MDKTLSYSFIQKKEKKKTPKIWGLNRTYTGIYIIYVTGWEKCAVRPGTPHLQDKCYIDWAIWPETLSPLWWLSQYHDIHPYKFEICPQISEVNFLLQGIKTNQASMHSLPMSAKCQGVKKCAVRQGLEPRTPRLQC